ncbi:flavonol synthase/flavanone 3-hydroxylase-like [Momordica charantia]|uniref:Flavonol synthase/flavanone 3-hydroxylase-like n=1 Tax=Momordica charantia TaxID=3673 RepID=A0A6J1C2Z2_MOMCH|nr:flavonol synthase/flavanone 3-hydroxylase-like [Momordica charantia]
MGEALAFDPAFIQAIEHRPELEPIDTVDEVPTIDLSVSDSRSIEQLVSEIASACEKWGFFQVINHGVPVELHARLDKAAKSFFDQTVEEKRNVKRDAANAMGFHDAENTKNVRDWKEVFDFLIRDRTLIPASHEPDDTKLRVLSNQWPQYPPGFRETCEEYARELELLADKLLGLICLSLGLPGAEGLRGYFKDDQTSVVRLNHYPPCPSPNLVLGVGHHKDAGALTILAQDGVGGLQVKRKSDGEWIPVKPIPNAYIVNIGDIVQVWSNDKYESVEHRAVVNTEKERFSFPFFFFPAHHMMVKPLEELVNDQNPSKYREYNWGKFFCTRNRSDYQKQKVENIQIDHFRLLV